MVYQVVAIVGAVLLLGAYFSYQRGWMGREQRLFSLMNVLGAGMLTWVALIDRRWGFVLVEGVWTLLSLPALIRPPRPGSAGHPTGGSAGALSSGTSEGSPQSDPFSTG